MKFLRTSAFVLVCIFSLNLQGQDSLNYKYQEMIDQTETFNQYKVIPRTRLDNFWDEVMAKLRANTQSIESLSAEVALQRDTVQSVNAKMASVQAQLEESLTQNNSIVFLGLELSKGAYHVIVWSIIFVALVLASVLYMMFSKSNRVTNRAKKELESLQLAFEDHKNQSREKQVKLKRELQTAVNTIDEMKRGRG